MALDLPTVIKQLTDSGIIAQGKLENFVPPKASPKDADELSQELVKSNLLTNFQAQHVKAGKVKSLILGGYTILDKIGAGGMGQVFKAQHRRMDRIVAIKMLPQAMTKDAAAAARFEREARAAAKLLHPNIVSAFDADQANGSHFLVMEYVEGKDLSALVKKNGPFSVAKAVNYVLQAARGLEFAHKKGVIHRDIKPANLLLDNEETVKILDMGLARIEAGGDVAAQAELTGTGTIMGTVDYMAPEQGLSTKHADARADIYSLGCTLHYLLVGKATYGGETLAGKLLAHHHDPIPELQQLRDDVPEQVQAVFKKMVAKKIENRYQTMTEVVADLEKCQAAITAAASSSTTVWKPPANTDQSSDMSIFMQHQKLARIDNSDDPFAAPEPEKKKPRQAKTKTKPKTKTKSQLSRPVLIGLVAAGVLGIIALAGVIISFRTKDGTLIVEVNQPDAVVKVLDGQGKIEISQPGGLQPISITVIPGKHGIKVEKDGFTTITDSFEIESGGKLDIKARLVPVKVAAATAPKIPPTTLATTAKGVTPAKPLTNINDPAFQQWVKATQALPAEKQIEAVRKKLMELNPGFDGKVTPKIEGGVVRDVYFYTDNLADISPVRALVGLRGLNCSGRNANRGKLSNLTPLQGMKLTNLSFSNTQESDLSPLRGMPLTYLFCDHTDVSDLNPLADCKDLKTLKISGTKVTPAQVAALQKALPNCKIEWDDPAKATPSKPITNINDPAFQAWMKTVAAMTAAKQVEAVAKKLQELNPGFDGVVTGADGSGTPKIENGVVTEFAFFTDNVTDISPVRALPGLKVLKCCGSIESRGMLSDLSALGGLKLYYLNCDRTNVVELTPLQGMPLTSLRCSTTQVADLSVLRTVPTLGNLTVQHTKVTPTAVAALQKALPNCKIEWDGAAKLAYLDPAFQQWIKATQALPAEQQIEAVSKKLMELNPGFDGKVTGADGNGMPRIESNVITDLGLDVHDLTDISPVRALTGLKSLACRCDTAGRKSKGQFSDLSPLEGMKLSSLRFGNTQISDLAPLKGMRLSRLSCMNSQVFDMEPLAGMPLEQLSCEGTPVSDLSPLAGASLIKLSFTPKNITKGIEVVRQMRSLRTIGELSPAEFWKKYDAGEFGKPAAPAKLAYLDPAFQQWVKATQALPAEQQIEAVSKKLMELNPEFDGKVTGGDGKGTPKIENGVITELGFYTDKVNDISPLRALTLNVLACGGSPTVRGKLSDLSPLQGMHLIHLTCGKTSVFDLLPLKDMRLTVLKCYDTQVTDLAPLERMKLTYLDCRSTSVSDLSPLADCKGLTSLHIDNTKVTAAGVAALQRALPNCKIEWDDPGKPKTPGPAASGTK